MFIKTIFGRAGPAANAASRSCSGGFGMPLRAKILSSPLTQRARMSTSSLENVHELPGDEPEDVLFGSLYGVRTIQLNRPKKLNSLNASMIRKIAPRLREWEKSDMANVVVMKGAGDKAFCAGGDVAILAEYNQEGPDGWKKSADYFELEYNLDHYIATYKKPYVAFMDGITMGGGVGLSVHAPFRIATERTVFAMPETTIGFFPDVGASFFLPKMNGYVGSYLALTSDRLSGINVFYSGVATHYLHSTSLNALESRLAELRFKDYDDLDRRLALVNDTIEEYCTGLPHDQPMLLAGELRKAIDRCFSKNTVKGILQALGEERGTTEEWAQKTIATLHKRSPSAVHVALRQMRIGGEWSMKETFWREHQIASKFMQHPDFTEGVSALLIRKEKPKWQPATLEDIKESGAVTEPFFQSLSDSDMMTFWVDRDYTEYPFSKFGVPTEAEIFKIVSRGEYKLAEVQQMVVQSRKSRQGVAEVVAEIMARKVTTDQHGRAAWVHEHPLDADA